MALRKNKEYLYLLVLLLAGVLVRVGLLYLRWINPDEGAHLMDARMVLDGLRPVVDYESRQPFYIYSLAMLFKFLGVHLWVGRLLPLISTIGTSVMLFLIGRRMFNSIVGLIACAVYLFLPLSLVWSTIVKSETLAVFLGCISIFFMLKTFDHAVRNAGWIILAGMFAALAFYSRQLSIYLPAITFFYFLLRRDTKIRQKFSFFLQYLLGYAAICVAFGAFYIQDMGIQALLFSQLNPLNLVYINVLNLFGALPEELQVAQSSGIRLLDQDMAFTLKQWTNVFYFSLFILVGAFAVGVRAIFGSDAGNRIRKRIAEHRNHYILLILWLVLVLLPYIVQSIVRGYYTNYFMELLPPLILLASLYFEVLFRKTGARFFLFLPVALSSHYLFFLVQKVLWRYYPGIGIYMLIGALVASLSLYFFIRKWEFKIMFILNLVSTLIIGVLYYSLIVAGAGEVLSSLLTMFLLYFVIKHLSMRLMKYNDNKHMRSFVRFYIIIVAFVITGAYSGRYIGPQYNSVWSPQTLKQVNQVLQDNSEVRDQVLSGASIWGLEQYLYPFLGKTHPTEFLKQAWPDFEKQFQENRPRFIIVDGYTEKKFVRFWDIIDRDIRLNYTEIARFSGSLYPVIIYKLNDEQNSSQSFLVLQNS